ncbi:MAG: hypothetical protein GY757_55610 [bacterium]|nr:hypothetical protein [bacterium]
MPIKNITLAHRPRHRDQENIKEIFSPNPYNFSLKPQPEGFIKSFD